MMDERKERLIRLSGKFSDMLNSLSDENNATPQEVMAILGGLLSQAIAKYYDEGMEDEYCNLLRENIKCLRKASLDNEKA